MTRYLPKPSSDSSFSRAIAAWRADAGQQAPEFGVDPRSFDERPTRGWRAYATYGVAAVLALGAGATAASLATAPALTDSIETVAAIDARQQGFATNLDPTGQQKKAATVSKDIGALKTEITRLQRALDQSRANQSAQTRTAAGQVAANAEEVKSLKAEIAGLQKTLDGAKGDAAAKIEGLNAKLEQSKQDAAQVAQLRERLDRFEKFAQADKAPAAKRSDRIEPETTGSIDPAPKKAPEPQQQAARDEQSQPQQPETRQAAREDAPKDMPKIMRNWTVRDVHQGVALLEGREGMIEVVRGARAPGMGRVRSIERRDGQWVVVTDRGLVLQREEL